ncbi:TlpA disulfide reductase family protein [Leucobacter luti]|uniref:Thiol-disulfide isomerase/thioredoxin n=1 Tax=Leucobacter luti TaxID=340320 RepID=A0A4R6RV18_9MICO|nr:TlpA disulfide reductase family protein [Leucobacter luti]MCW2289648.1 peroxiredoxin [Leucobacter luti]QYM77181.1 TlpA family protein disulfide reductase [Leucobacter luti]TCK37819.1 thiol-disulfide isomerase/thioredoxin [Leucobacter luti]TDP90811.1 thiol-disulfide isomerase/thioredoxin [Leucobacter luti]
MNRRRIGAVVALGLTAALALSGCSGGGNDLAKQWQESNEKGYVSGDGTSASFPPSDRTEPVEFSGEIENGDTLSSDELRGKVTVVNFWYAGCAPCRAEAPDLVEAYDEFAGDDVAFLGVNTRDQVAQAQQFSEEFNIEYPSIMDMPGGRSVQRAFAGQVPLNAVPTTLILDREGRVAHRVLGQLAAASQLSTLIKETLAEGETGGGDAAGTPGSTDGQPE